MTLYTEFRPLAGSWPRPLLHWTERRRSDFSASYDTTLDLLEREVNKLGTDRIVIQLDLPESKIRNDGLPYSNAGDPGHPGIIISFTSKWGPLRYLTDNFDRWKDNLRAVALSLESLRKVDRYGVSHDGEQYRGYAQLGAGGEAIALGAFSPEEAAKILLDGAAMPSDGYMDLLRDWAAVRTVYRTAAGKVHPDRGGSDDAFALVANAYRVLARHLGQEP